MKLKTETDKGLTGVILKFVAQEHLDGRPKTLFETVRKHVEQRYLPEQISEDEIAIRCFDLADVGLLMVYVIEKSVEESSYSRSRLIIKKGIRPAVAATDAGLSYAGRVLMKQK